MQLLDVLPAWLRQVLIGLVVFLAGGLFAFGYSYRPLHGAKNWRIEQLEARLDSVNVENVKLSDELAGLRAQASARVDPETLAQVEKELEKTRRALAQAEKEAERQEKKRRDADAVAVRWRKRYEELRDAQASRPAPAIAPPAAAAPGDFDPAPSTPDVGEGAPLRGPGLPGAFGAPEDSAGLPGSAADRPGSGLLEAP